MTSQLGGGIYQNIYTTVLHDDTVLSRIGDDHSGKSYVMPAQCEGRFLLIAVSQLRGHCEGTGSKVVARKNELDDLLADNQKFHSKLHEVDVWLTGIEERYGMLTAASEDKSVLEQQVAEHQVYTI